VITKPKGAPPDYDEPVILPIENRTVAKFCQQIHRKLLADFKHALVWGKSVKHQPQRVGKDHVLEDEDIVQIIKKI
jgi:ribosome-interacting GTPase 1